MRKLRLCCISFLLSCNLLFASGVFDSVRLLPQARRMGKALEIYDSQVKRKDSVFSIQAIRALQNMADSLGDPSLQCFSLSLLADQYARIRGFNAYSTQLHEAAVAMAEKNDIPLLIGTCTYRLGGYYYSFKKYPLAFEYLLRADTYFREIGYSDVPDIDKILFFIGGIYYETGNYEKSEGYLLRMQQLPAMTDYLRKQSLNTLAMIYKNLKDTARAMQYFQLTLQEAERQKDSAWIGISLGNIGNHYFSAHRYEKAYPLLQQAAGICKTHELPAEAFTDILHMARIELLQGNAVKAATHIHDALALPVQPLSLSAKRNLYESQALYYHLTGQQAKAFELQQLLIQVKDSIAETRDRQAYDKIMLRIETDKHLSDIGKLEADAKADSVRRNAVIIVLILVLIVMVLLYLSYRMRAKNTTAMLTAEKKNAEEKLEHAKALLRDFTRNNREKNALIEQFAAELERLKANMTGNPVYEERLRNFDKLMRSTILTDEEWAAFRELFDKVYKDFFHRLDTKIPGLTVTDTRLLALVKLELADTEIAHMMGIDSKEVNARRQKLKNLIHPADDGITLEDLVRMI